MSDPANEPPLVTRPSDGAPGEPPLVMRPSAFAPKRPHPGFWEAVLWCGVFLLGQSVGAIVGIFVVFVAYSLDKPDPGKFMLDQLETLGKASGAKGQGERPEIPFEIGQSLAWGMLTAQFFALALVAIVLPLRIGPGWKRQLGVRRPAGLHVLLVLLVWPGFVLSADAIQTAFVWVTGLQPEPSEKLLTDLFRGFPWPLTLLAVAIGPGVVEEFWCRGFLGRGLSARYGLRAGVFITSVLFAAMHLDSKQLIVFVLMGGFLHFAYIATRSIWPSVLLHALNNGAAVFLALTLSPEKLREPFSLTLILAALALVTFGAITLWTSRAIVEPTSTPNGTSEWKPEYPGVSTPPPGEDARLGYATVSPVALIFTLVSFVTVVFLLYRHMI